MAIVFCLVNLASARVVFFLSFPIILDYGGFDRRLSNRSPCASTKRQADPQTVPPSIPLICEGFYCATAAQMCLNSPVMLSCEVCVHVMCTARGQGGIAASHNLLVADMYLMCRPGDDSHTRPLSQLLSNIPSDGCFLLATSNNQQREYPFVTETYRGCSPHPRPRKETEAAGPYRRGPLNQCLAP